MDSNNSQNIPLSELIQSYESVGLKDMDRVKLLTRKDTKYVLNDEKIQYILGEIKDDYFVMEINDFRHMRYKTLYYDTPDYRLYTLHHNGKLNRYKVRSRSYVDTNASFFEVKFKDNKSNTIKTRYSVDQINERLDQEANDFVEEKTIIDPTTLVPAMWVHYKRLTLVSKKFDERVTIDTDLTFEFNGEEKKMEGLVIAELKQDKNTKSSRISDVLRDMKIENSGMSKYCLGVASLIEGVKKNNFKPKILKIEKAIR